MASASNNIIWEKIDNCRGFARSLVNNLSLGSGRVLLPTNDDLAQVCQHLTELAHSGFDFTDEENIINLIHTAPIDNPILVNLVNTLKNIKIGTAAEQKGGGQRSHQRQPIIYPLATKKGQESMSSSSTS